MVLGPAAVLGDPLHVEPLVGRQAPGAGGELLLGEQAGLDPLGELDLLLGVEQRNLADLLQVVLDRVGRSAAGCHLGGGQVLVVIAGNERLVLALLARRFGRAGGQRPADLHSAAVSAGVCRVIQAQGSADTSTGSCSELWPVGQPRSGCTRRGFGGAARQLPGAGGPRNFGGCRAGAWRVCHRITSASAGPQRAVPGSTPGWPGWLATQAPLPNMQDYKAGHTEPARAVCQVPEDKMTENQRGGLVLPHTTLGGVRGGSNAARRQVIQIPAGFCPHPPQTVDLPRFPDDLRCPGVSRSRVAGSWPCYGPDLASPKFAFDRGEPAPGMSDSRTGFAATGPGAPGPVPGTLAATARGLPYGHGQPDPSRPWAGWPSHRPRGQAHH